MNVAPPDGETNTRIIVGIPPVWKVILPPPLNNDVSPESTTGFCGSDKETSSPEPPDVVSDDPT